MRQQQSQSWRRHALWLAIPAFAGVTLSAGPAFASDPDPDRVVTFARDVAPILQENCQICHQPGAIGPMSLLTYEEVRPWASVIKLRVEQQEMPPYHYDTDVGIQELKHDKRLTAEQIETIALWVDQGAPLGDPIRMIGTSGSDCRIDAIKKSSRDLKVDHDESGGDERKSTVPNMMLTEVGGPPENAAAYRSTYFANETPTFG